MSVYSDGGNNRSLREMQDEIKYRLRNPKKHLPAGPLQLTDGQIVRQRELVSKVKARQSGRVGEGWGK